MSYGSFALLRHLQSHLPIEDLALSGSPKIERRVLRLEFSAPGRGHVMYVEGPTGPRFFMEYRLMKRGHASCRMILLDQLDSLDRADSVLALRHAIQHSSLPTPPSQDTPRASLLEPMLTMGLHGLRALPH